MPNYSLISRSVKKTSNYAFSSFREVSPFYLIVHGFWFKGSVTSTLRSTDSSFLLPNMRVLSGFFFRTFYLFSIRWWQLVWQMAGKTSSVYDTDGDPPYEGLLFVGGLGWLVSQWLQPSYLPPWVAQGSSENIPLSPRGNRKAWRHTTQRSYDWGLCGGVVWKPKGAKRQ